MIFVSNHEFWVQGLKVLVKLGKRLRNLDFGFGFCLNNETLKVSIVLRFFRNFNVKMKIQKGVGLTSKYLGIGFGHAGIALTR